MTEIDRTKRIYLTGYMFSGKTTTGEKLASKLGYKFIDTDREIETKYHYTVFDIFAHFSEDVFRQMEHNMLKQLSEQENLVIATGGGTPCFFNNMEIIKNTGISVYLHMDIKQIIARESTNKFRRPLLYGKSVEEKHEYMTKTLEERTPVYMQSDIIAEGFNCDINNIIDKLKEYNINIKH